MEIIVLVVCVFGGGCIGYFVSWAQKESRGWGMHSKVLDNLNYSIKERTKAFEERKKAIETLENAMCSSNEARARALLLADGIKPLMMAVFAHQEEHTPLKTIWDKWEKQKAKNTESYPYKYWKNNFISKVHNDANEIVNKALASFDPKTYKPVGAEDNPKTVPLEPLVVREG